MILAANIVHPSTTGACLVAKLWRLVRHGRLRGRVALIPIAGAVLAASCTGNEVGRSEWALIGVSDDERQVRVSVFSGLSSCMGFDRVEVTEREDVVEIEGYAWHDGSDVCTDDFTGEPVIVELDDPLGDRDLVGCAGDFRFKGWNHPDDVDCSQTHL